MSTTYSFDAAAAAAAADDDDDELFLRYGWPTKGVYLFFSAGTIVKDPQHRKSPTRREQGLNLPRTWVQARLNEAVQ